MADTTYVPTPMSGDMFGGGNTLGAILIGSLLGGRGLLGGYGGAVGAEAIGTNQILQSLNQNQLAGLATQIGNSTQQLSNQNAAAVQVLTQDIFGSSQATQNAIANSTLQGTISSLQGQKDLTATILGSTMTNAQGHTNILGQIAASAADTNANINNARQGISGDIREALGVIDSDLHGMNSSIGSALDGIRSDISNASQRAIDATHAAQVSTLEGNYRTLAAITNDGDKTRELITRNTIEDLNRQILEEREKRHHDHTVNTLTITNNNTALANAQQSQNQLQAQLQAQQIAALAAAVNGMQNLQQITIANGRGNNVNPNAVQV